jgi:putative ABC transport system permease protein
MVGLRWLGGLIRRRPGRMIAQLTSVGVAVLLLASLGAFFTASRARMTEHAVGAVPVDWQVQLTSGASTARALHVIDVAPNVTAALPVAFAETTGLTSRSAGTVQTTGPGKVLGIPSDYVARFPGEVRFLVGSRDGVLLAQQTAANLGAGVGSRVTIGRRADASVQMTVNGIVDLPTADSLFQAIGASTGAATAPPDNVVLLPLRTWHRLFPAGGPDTATQIHVQLAHDLPRDPGAAFAQVTGRAKNLEAALAGAGVVGDNLAAQLDAARADAIYAQMLFLFLGLPGVVIAALLVGVIVASGRERRIREQALLRVRGASLKQVGRAAGAEALFTGLTGATIGVVAAVIVGHMAFGTSSFGATRAQAIAWLIASFALATGLALVTIALPARRDARGLTVRDASLTEPTASAPRSLWERWWLDLICLGVGGLVYWQSVRSGYQVVLAPEGVPTISVSYFTMLAPLLFWLGAGLLIWRLGSLALRHGRTFLRRITRPVAHNLSGVVAATMSRRRRPIARGMLIMALAASFALSVAVFNSTYTAQARVDAELTNGADVTVTTSAATGLPSGLAEAVAGLPGVAAAQPMQHRFAYVGNDLQDLYGIEPTTIGQATSMSNAYFGNGDADATLGALASTPNGVLVSEETVHDFQLQPGDTVRLRLQFASDHAYHDVPFSYVGVAREFPTAPHDSFLVANAGYVAQRTGSDATQTVLIRANDPPPRVAAQVRGLLGPSSGATVQDIVSQQHITLSGLTAIDLAGLTKLELAFALMLTVGASGLVLALGLTERRRSFAIAAALGARRRQLGGFVWSEAGFVAIGGLVLGAISGWWLALVIVRILTGVFDPPPEHLTIPAGYVAAFAASTLLAALVAGWVALRVLQRPAIERIRDL